MITPVTNRIADAEFGNNTATLVRRLISLFNRFLYLEFEKGTSGSPWVFQNLDCCFSKASRARRSQAKELAITGWMSLLP